MENPVIIALVIAGIGMTLLFLSLALFYGLLVLLTRLLPERESSDQTLSEAHRNDAAEDPAKLQAALLAVAIARAEAELQLKAEKTGSEAANQRPDSEDVSPWWALHHQRRMGPDTPSRRTP